MDSSALHVILAASKTLAAGGAVALAGPRAGAPPRHGTVQARIALSRSRGVVLAVRARWLAGSGPRLGIRAGGGPHEHR
jgi:hypothetical protein